MRARKSRGDALDDATHGADVGGDDEDGEVDDEKNNGRPRVRADGVLPTPALQESLAQRDDATRLASAWTHDAIATAWGCHTDMCVREVCDGKEIKFVKNENNRKSDGGFFCFVFYFVLFCFVLVPCSPRGKIQNHDA